MIALRRVASKAQAAMPQPLSSAATALHHIASISDAHSSMNTSKRPEHASTANTPPLYSQTDTGVTAPCASTAA